MMGNRVVITGRGAVSPFGIGVPAMIQGFWAGESAVRSMPEWYNIKGLSSRIAAPVPQFNPKEYLPRTVRRTMGPLAIYAALASQEAIGDAALSTEMLASGEVGVAIGSTTGSASALQAFYSKYLPDNELEEIKSGEFFKMMGHSCAASVCLAFDIRGEQWAPVSACTSSSQSIGLGYLLVASGRQSVMLCGGADETHATVTGVFDLLRAASRNNNQPQCGCRPFDSARDGVVCGGGSGVVVLENYQSALERGAQIYGEIVGFGNVNDCGHIANPDTSSMARAMGKAMEEAGLNAGDIDYVNAHATGTELGDISEAVAISQAVDSTTSVSSLKGHMGHTLGAAGSLELITVLEMLKRQEVIPTRNLQEADPRCSSICLESQKKKMVLNTVLKNNFALGGVNTSLAIRRFGL